MRAHVAAIFVATACASSKSVDTPPTLQVDAPARGTTIDGATVTVSGSAHDDGAVRVTVNGSEVPLAKDGTFSTTVTLDAGISVIETHAIDKTGHDVRDTRAVLAGTLAATDGTKTAPVAMHASPTALTAI